MTEPVILYCVGATKAGTSALYRYLHDHPECNLPAVKEAHYWDTFAAEQREKQLQAFGNRLAEMRALRADAVAHSRGWQIANLDRRIPDMEALMDAVAGARTDDQGYLDWLMKNRGQTRVFADMTPNYALLPAETLSRMVASHRASKVAFLIRDPLDRLWSHIRMQARRQRQTHEIYEQKSNNILHRMLNQGHETHILHRGDYPAIITKLRQIVPSERLFVQFTENLFTQDGLSQMAAFLGITAVNPKDHDPVHQGPPVVIKEKLRLRALEMLSEQYDWVARNVGPLPQRWQDNQARIHA